MRAFALRSVAVVALLLASVACKKEAPAAATPPAPAPTAADSTAALPVAASSTVCPGPANAIGVGKACMAADDCKGQDAVTCPRAADPSGWDFCTRLCTGATKGECGAGAVCAAQGSKPAMCVPAACGDALTVALPQGVSLTADCQTPGNALGVGKACAAHGDCQANQAARFCPRAVQATEPGFCSMLCQTDPECGDGAFCWRRVAQEGGHALLVASCAPVACKAAGLPTPPTPAAP